MGGGGGAGVGGGGGGGRGGGGGGGLGQKEGRAGLKITVGHRTVSDQIRKLSDQTENIPYILSNRKI